MIKAVLFDCFGVLVTDKLLELLQERVHDEATWQEIWRHDDAVNRGEMTIDQYLEFLGAQVGLTTAEMREVFERDAPNEELLGYIASLKPRYKLAVVSNIAADILPELLGAHHHALFDATVLSCDLGIVKPDSRIYLAAAEAVGCEPSECLFVDDKERYCEPARALGMRTVRYQNALQCKNDCEVLLSQP